MNRWNRIRIEIATVLVALARLIAPKLREAAPPAHAAAPKPTPTYSRGPGQRKSRHKGHKADWNTSIVQQARDARFGRDL